MRNPPELRRCLACDAPFVAARRGASNQLYCGRDCKDGARYWLEGSPCTGGCGRRVRGKCAAPRCGICRHQSVVDCPVCGERFVPGTSRAAGGVQLTCSRSCGQAHRGGSRRPRPGERSCEVCGVAINRRHAGGKDAMRCCSRACGFELQRRERPPRKPKPPAPRKAHACRGCGRSTRPDERWRVWCGYRCRVNDIGDRVKSLYRLAAQAGAEGAQWRQLLVGYLRERDGDRCGICRRAIRFDLPAGPRGDDRGPSIDHMLPRSRGGSDDLANLRLAHWGCNRARKTGFRGEMLQLALIG